MTYDVTIIGAGIVGLATGYQLLQQQPGLQIAILEKEATVATHQTGHNSGVIHSGIYYKPGSLKARNCINGYHQLLAFCGEQDIPYEICGKVIVATDTSELPALEGIYQRGIENGLEGLQWLEPEAIREREPHVRAVKGIWVPQTGIVDYKAMATKLARLITEQGDTIITGQKVVKINHGGNTVNVVTTSGTTHSRILINCAGLYSDKVAEMAGINAGVRIIPFRGEYYNLKTHAHGLVQNLIYPVPDPAFPFLGVHFTRMIHGGVEAGPNAVLAYRREGYTNRQLNGKEFWETLRWPGFRKLAWKYRQTGLKELYRSYSKAAFLKALQKLIPEIQAEDLEPGGAGVRAQACDREGNLPDDFVIRESKRGVHVLNAPSPAATACLSIGETVAGFALAKLKNGT